MGTNSKFKVSTIYEAIDKMTSTHKRIERSNSKMANKVSANAAMMERKFRVVGDRAARIGRQSLVMGTAIATPMVLMANESVKFEKSMSNVSTLIDTQTEDIGKMGEEVLKMAERMPVPIEEMTSALYDIRSAGIPAENAMEALEASSKLAAAGLATVQEATDITTSAFNAFRSEGKSVNEINDILFKTVKFGKTTVSQLAQAFGANAPIIQSAGVTLADFSAATAALTTLGTPASQAQNQIAAAISALQKPTGEMEKVFKKLGVTTEKELIAKYGTLGKSFKAISDASGELDLKLAKVFGRKEALSGVTSLLGETSDAYVSTLNEMTKGSEALTTAFEKQSSTSAAQLQLAKNNLQSVAITLGNALLPVLTDLLNAIMPSVKAFSRWAKNNKQFLGTVFKVAAAVAGLSFAVSGLSFVVSAFSKVMAFASSIMLANPIFLIAAAAVAAGAAIYGLAKAFKTTSAAAELNAEIQERVLDRTIDQRAEAAVLFEKLRKLEAGTKAYNSTLAQLEKIQPGIVKNYNLQSGAIENINAAEKELMKTIMKRAEMEVRAEMMKEKIKEKIQLGEEGLGFWDKAWEATKRVGLAASTFGLSETTGAQSMIIDSAEEKQAQRVARLEEQIGMLGSQIAEDELAQSRPQLTMREELLQRKETAEKMGITINAEGLPDWIKVHVQPGDFGGTMPNVTQTN